MKIILGSSSPRRKDILGKIFESFEIITPETDEGILEHEAPDNYARRISRGKAHAIQSALPERDAPCLIITSDTIVTIDGKIIGKPANFNDAVGILTSLSGRTHEVISAITLLARDGATSRERTQTETSRITFKPLLESDITGYLGKIEYIDKAGAYAAQEWGEIIIESIAGSRTNVIGFPLRLFFKMCAEMNLLNRVFRH